MQLIMAYDRGPEIPQLWWCHVAIRGSPVTDGESSSWFSRLNLLGAQGLPK